MSAAAVLSRPPERCPYEPRGAARQMWRSARPEVLSCGPADTGKSRGALEKLHYCADKYAGARIIMVRKTRASLTQSAMVTYEKKVLPLGWLGSRIVWHTSEQQYEYPNGSIIAVGGMDKPSKVMSSEWDIIYVMEATELFEDDWETLSIRKRNSVMPYQQLLGDCNPSYPTHWLKRRCDRGDTLLLHATFADNPSFTPQRRAILEKLTGVRRARLYDGVWAAAEGMVYTNWHPPTHLIDDRHLHQWGLLYADGSLNRQVIRQFVGGVDWGYSNPGVLQVWAVDGDGRMFLLREVYRTQRTDDWWVSQAQALDAEFGGIDQWVADPSQPAYIRKFNDAGLPTVAADNAIIPGVTAMQARLALARDGRPRLYVHVSALRERDEARDDAHQPIWFEGEINEYSWPKRADGQPIKEVPVKVNDHAMDAARYVCMYLDSQGVPATSAQERQALRRLHQYRGY